MGPGTGFPDSKLLPVRFLFGIVAEMYVFVDESGVHSPSGFSSVAIVYVKTSDIERLEQKVLEAERSAGIHGFHWAHRNWQIREKFITSLVDAKFKVKIAILTNPTLIDRRLEEALAHLIIEKHIHHILIDGSKPKKYVQRLKKVMRDKGVSVKKIRTINDQSAPIMRIADAFAGLLRYHYDKPGSQATKLFELVKNKVEIIVQI